MCIPGKVLGGLNKLHKRPNYKIRKKLYLGDLGNITFIDQKFIQDKPLPLEGYVQSSKKLNRLNLEPRLVLKRNLQIIWCNFLILDMRTTSSRESDSPQWKSMSCVLTSDLITVVQPHFSYCTKKVWLHSENMFWHAKAATRFLTCFNILRSRVTP